ncbi:MAG: tryptophan--tRNA ligase, partial [Thermoplasmata archaeon]
KMMNAKTGGGSTIEEHRKFGGKPEECSVYEYYVYHLVDDDNYLKEVHDTCKAGTRLCGNCKKEAIEKINLFLKDLKEKREIAKEELDKYVRFN